MVGHPHRDARFVLRVIIRDARQGITFSPSFGAPSSAHSASARTRARRPALTLVDQYGRLASLLCAAPLAMTTLGLLCRDTIFNRTRQGRDSVFIIQHPYDGAFSDVFCQLALVVQTKASSPCSWSANLAVTLGASSGSSFVNARQGNGYYILMMHVKVLHSCLHSAHYRRLIPQVPAPVLGARRSRSSTNTAASRLYSARHLAP